MAKLKNRTTGRIFETSNDTAKGLMAHPIYKKRLILLDEGSTIVASPAGVRKKEEKAD